MPYKHRIINRIVRFIGICLLVLPWVFTILAIKKSGEKVPSHFKLDGTIDGYADKWILWILPVVGTVMYFVMAVLIYFLPRILSYSISFSETKKPKRQLAISNLLKTFQILFTGQITCLSLSVLGIVTNRIHKVPAFIFPGFLMAGLFLIILLLIQYFRSDKVTEKIGG